MDKKSFRETVVDLGEKATEIMAEYFKGERPGTDKVKEASKMITQAIKVEHINQIKNQSDRSFALRLLPLMPKDDKTRRAYIALTNPELKPLLLDKPERKKD